MEEQEKCYKVFIVIDEMARVAYVDKSAAKDLQPILRRFVYREHPYAKQLLEGVVEPNLVLVEQQPLSPCKQFVADVYVYEHVDVSCFDTSINSTSNLTFCLLGQLSFRNLLSTASAWTVATHRARSALPLSDCGRYTMIFGKAGMWSPPYK